MGSGHLSTHQSISQWTNAIGEKIKWRMFNFWINCLFKSFCRFDSCEYRPLVCEGTDYNKWSIRHRSPIWCCDKCKLGAQWFRSKLHSNQFWSTNNQHRNCSSIYLCLPHQVGINMNGLVSVSCNILYAWGYIIATAHAGWYRICYLTLCVIMNINKNMNKTASNHYF